MTSKIKQQDWLRSSKLTPTKCLIITFLCYLFLVLLHISGGREFIYNRIVHPVQFKIRNYIFNKVELDKNIKIFAVEQETISKIGLETVPIEDWTALFTALGKLKPKAVIIDKLFSLRMSQDPKKVEELVQAIQSVPKVVAGAIYSENEIPGYTSLKKSYITEDLPVLKAADLYIYGPRSEIVDSFDYVGFTNLEDHGIIKPFVKSTRNGVAAHWGLFAGDIKSNNEDILVNGNKIHLDQDQQLILNLLHPDVYWSKTYSLLPLLERARSKTLTGGITSEDTVIILTAMHQGGVTSFRNTPAGSMPAGFLMAEVVHSTLKNRWFKYVGYELFILTLFCLLGFWIGYAFSSLKFWIILFTTPIILATAGLIAFCYLQTVLPWAFPSLGLFFSGLAVYIEKSRLADMKAQAIQYSLEGMIDPAKLQNIVNSSETFKIEPKNQVLTVMFIDIAGFSALAEKETPTEVFNHLRNLMTSISDIVHKNGGIIDRSLGDGLLCFFGYRFEEGDLQDHSHIRQAVDCAIEIQKMALQNGHAALKNKQPIFPLRIGLNTGEVYAGDIGGSHKIDFTIIGHAVNFAQRMESACENYKIMCGAATFDNLQFDENLRTKFSEKLISIKHYKNLVKAYEIDPFGGDEQSQQDCEELRRAFDKNTRAEERINVPLSWGLTVQAESDIKGQVVNFSKSGFEVIFNKYLGRSAGLSLNLSSELMPITDHLKNNYLDQITVEVRWSMQTGSNRYKTGVKFKNLSENQKEVLLNFLKSNLDDGLPDQGLKS